MCVPSSAKLYDDQITPRQNFLLQVSCNEMRREKGEGQIAVQRELWALSGGGKKKVQPRRMAEQDINSNIKLNIIIIYKGKGKKKKSLHDIP